VYCKITKKTIPAYNSFINLYIEKGFVTENLEIEIDEFLDSYEDTPKYKNLPVIKFMSVVDFPFNRMSPFKVTEMFVMEEIKVEIANLDEIYFKFNCLDTSLMNARTIYDFKYQFKEEIRDFCKELRILFDYESKEYLIDTVKKVLAYFIEMFPNVAKITLEGEEVNLTKFFTLTEYVKSIDEMNKIEMCYDKPKKVEDQLESDDDSYDEYNLQTENSSSIDLANVEFGYYDKTNKKSFLATSKKFKLSFYNDKWVQIGRFIYIFDFFEFEVGKISMSAGEKIANKIKEFHDFISNFEQNNDENKYNDEFEKISKYEFTSFVIIQLSATFIPTRNPNWMYENQLNNQGHIVNLIFTGDIEYLYDLNKELEGIDDKTLLDIEFENEIDFSSMQGQRLLGILEHKRLYGICTDEHEQTQNSVISLISFLELEHVKLNSLSVCLRKLKMAGNASNPLVSMILNALKHNMMIRRLKIETKEKLDDKTEQVAIQFIEKRVG